MRELTSICGKLVNNGKIPLEEMKRFPHISGIYMILRYDEPLYVGRTKDVHSRLVQHLTSGAQKIGHYLKAVQEENVRQGYHRRANLFAKFVECADPARFERKIIACIERDIGKRLRYNIQRGNT